MTPQFVKLTQQKVAFYETGAGAPLFFIHGNSASGLAFRRQLESGLAATHRLIAIDLPGHGDSDPMPVAADYGMPGYARVVADVAAALGAEDAVFVGWSLGGHIALEGVSLLPRARGFVIFGTPPLAFPPDMANAFKPNPAVNVGFAAEVTAEQAQLYAASFFAPAAAPDLAPFVADILRTNGAARAGLAASIRPDGYSDEVQIVAAMSTPLAVLHGAEEQLVSARYIAGLHMPTLWRGEIQFISDAGHAPQWEQPKVFNGLMAAFAADAA